MSGDGSPAEGPTRRELHGRVRRLEITAAALALALAGAVGWVAVGATADHDVLTTERLEIVEPDGQPAFVLANSERPAQGTFDGDVLLKDLENRRAMPNFIFFDGHGDEVGGMLFDNRETGEGFAAVRHLSLDGYKQDQTVQLFHRQNPDGASSGLSVTDRPEDRSLRETFTDELGLELPVTPEAADSALAEALESGRVEDVNELFGVNRLFLGSNDNGEARLVLKDADGRPRIALGVPGDGQPYLQILDEDGEAMAELP